MTKRLDPLETAKQIEGTYKRYLKTLLAPSNPIIARAFDDAVDRSSILTKGPMLELTPPYAPGASLSDLIAEGTLHADFGRPRQRSPPDRPALYRHQEHAIRKVVAGRNLVVSTGTGSGKTESFLLPILNSLIAERAARKARARRACTAAVPDERARQRPAQAAARGCSPRCRTSPSADTPARPRNRREAPKRFRRHQPGEPIASQRAAQPRGDAGRAAAHAADQLRDARVPAAAARRHRAVRWPALGKLAVRGPRRGARLRRSPRFRGGDCCFVAFARGSARRPP